ncbi:NifB/NifX family molybdenum-iron cluster-binding protein [Natroniella acetigena]|uniref:NifB/NifX family molybdenum-iron cluster-binding protein n=1 Tax=Natroniella acetigena TaxID=52004 RepID=UPI00200A6CE4|nr:NifB/NifX family molybdenum-iron cluster-binding protein [Natroniella acetigena]MCK8827660.1 NifB/NifX family molybdenum-iron cluster-binding protein [Natroniella acetigena]
MKKVAIPTDGGQVAGHFGRCPEFTIFDIDGGEIVNKEIIQNPGHKPGFLPKFLNGKDVDAILAGGMGRRAVDLFDENNIEVVTGVTGDVEVGVKSYLADNLDTKDAICDHDDHDCEH